MVQEVERRPAGARPLLQVPDAERAEQPLQDVALEPVVQQLRDRHRQDARKIDHRLLAEAPDVQANGGDPRQLARIVGLDVGGRREIEALQHAGERTHAPAELRPLRRVCRADAADRLRRACHVARQLERPRTGERGADPWIGLVDPQAGAGKAEVADNDLGYPADVGCGVRRRTLLDHEDALAGPCQIMGGHEAVSSCADHDRVVLHVPSFRMRIAASRPDAPMIPPPGCVPDPHW